MEETTKKSALVSMYLACWRSHSMLFNHGYPPYSKLVLELRSQMSSLWWAMDKDEQKCLETFGDPPVKGDESPS